MLLENFLSLLEGWAPAFRQKRTCQRAIALALGLLCGLGRMRHAYNSSNSTQDKP